MIDRNVSYFSENLNNTIKSDCAMLYTDVKLDINLNYQNINLLPALNSKIITDIKFMLSGFLFDDHEKKNQIKLYKNDTMLKIDLNQKNCIYRFSDVILKCMVCSLSQKQYHTVECFKNIFLSRLHYSKNDDSKMSYGAISFDLVCKNENLELVRPFKNFVFTIYTN